MTWQSSQSGSIVSHPAFNETAKVPMAYHLRRVTRTWGALTCMCCIGFILIGERPAKSQELLAYHLHRIADGEIPLQDWYPDQRPALHEQTDLMRSILDQLDQIDEDAIHEINLAYANRIILISGHQAPKSLERIETVCDKHQAFTDLVNQIKWAETPDQGVSFDIEHQSRKFQAMVYLINLRTLLEYKNGRTDDASKTLASGFAFAHNLMRTNNDINLLVGYMYQTVLLNAVADLQSMGSPYMTGVTDRLNKSLVTRHTVDQILWSVTCSDLPILSDRPRQPDEWVRDVRALFRTFKQTSRAPKSPEQAELLGRQFQSLILVGQNFKSLSEPIQYVYGGTENAAPALSKHLLDIQQLIVLPVFAKYVETRLDRTFLSRARARVTARLVAIECVEQIRRQSQAQGGWLTQLEADFQASIPFASGENWKPEVTVIESFNGFPAYEIQFPQHSSLAWFTESPMEPLAVSVNVAEELSR
ncbi:hypothetical protein [Rhodopirellula sp. MGV]|uniref:hypothetical protein n=1 Tax=Rhodopirellula sp. MGV TaxID=2023130 RepID=UPI000B96CF4C|nr:hypothetical protein [Rhodopirellula sp. MGV]